MSVRDTLSEIEKLVGEASHMPLTDKCLVSENDLVHLVSDLRNDLPHELDQAAEIMSKEDEIYRAAHREADEIVKKAKEYAKEMTNSHEITKKAKEEAKSIRRAAEEQARGILEKAIQESSKLRGDVNSYSNQVFDQLIAHVSGTYQGFQQAQASMQQTQLGLQQACQTLMQAKEQLNQEVQQQMQAEAKTKLSFAQTQAQAAAPQQGLQPKAAPVPSQTPPSELQQQGVVQARQQ